MMLKLFVFVYQTIISPIQESNTQRYLIVQQQRHRYRLVEGRVYSLTQDGIRFNPHSTLKFKSLRRFLNFSITVTSVASLLKGNGKNKRMTIIYNMEKR